MASVHWSLSFSRASYNVYLHFHRDDFSFLWALPSEVSVLCLEVIMKTKKSMKVTETEGMLWQNNPKLHTLSTEEGRSPSHTPHDIHSSAILSWLAHTSQLMFIPTNFLTQVVNYSLIIIFYSIHNHKKTTRGLQNPRSVFTYMEAWEIPLSLLVLLISKEGSIPFHKMG